MAERADMLPGGLFDHSLAQRIAGMAAAAASLWDQAQEHFEQATRQSNELPNRIERPQVLHWYAKMLLDQAKPHDHERALTMLTEALHDYRHLGMPIHAEITQALLE